MALPRAAFLASLLALLLLLPQGFAAAPAGRPSLAVVRAPTYSPGDVWEYRNTLVGKDGNVTAEQNWTRRVEALEDFAGTPAYRLNDTLSVRSGPDPSDRLQVVTTDITNRTFWLAEQGLQTLHIDITSDRNTESPLFKQLARKHSNNTFHTPEDRYQFPLLGGGATGEGDAWVVETNVTMVTNSSFFTRIGNNATNVSFASENTTDITDRASAAWIRQDVLNTSAGQLDVVVFQVLSGNTTVYEFWAPMVGSFVRQEFLGPDGHLIQTIVLRSYSFQKPPDLGTATQGQGADLAPQLGVALLLVVGLIGLLAWRRRGRARP
jgi:hypothetical protein